MRFQNATALTDPKDELVVEIANDGGPDFYPLTMTICAKGDITPFINIHISDLQQLEGFKNSLDQEYERIKGGKR